MEYFSVTFKFDNADNTLNQFNGLSIEVLADFLKSLNSVTKGVSDDGLVLSNISGNCYAIELSTPSVTTFKHIETLHEQIANGNLSALKSNEKMYAKKLTLILVQNSLMLSVYNSDKTFYKTIQQKEIPEIFPYFYETDAICGTLTKIGATSLNANARNTIVISSYAGEIEISNSQDNELRNHYKKGVLEFYITKKINSETRKIEKTTLDDFIMIVPHSVSFTNTLKEVRANHGEYFSKIEIDE